MGVIICPWCQSEIMQEEGQEPDKICPVCDNEIDGYRTLKLNIGDSDEDEEEDEDEYEGDSDDREKENELDDQEFIQDAALAASVDIDWEDDSSSDELIQFDELVEKLIDEQELAPECPLCHEYMLETGEQLMTSNQFRPRIPEMIGEAIIEAPFTLNLYMCPNCFSVQSILSDSHRHQVVSRLSQDRSLPKE